MATKKKPITPLPCKCGRSAASVKIGKLFHIYCCNAYCTESRPVKSEKEETAIKMWNTQVRS